MADSIEMLFGVVGRVGPNSHILGAYIGSIFPCGMRRFFAEMQRIRRMCLGDAALPTLPWDFLTIIHTN